MFELSPHIDKNKIFLVNLSEIEGVLSPLFFKSKPKFLEYNQKLKKIANVNPVRNKPKFDDNDLVPYVGLPETDEHTRKIVNVVLRPYKEVKGRNIIYPNDILFARIEPSIFNQKYIYAGNLKGYDFAFTSTEFYIIEQKSVNIQYIFHLLFSDYVFNQIKGKTTGSTGRRRLDLDAFKNIEIPVFPTQQQIIDLYEKAYNEKQQKEAEAERLLNSIDDYLLGELGIELPQKDNSLENRIFRVNFSEVTGGRFDPFYFQTYFKKLETNLYKGKYNTIILREVCDLLNGYAFKNTDYVNISNTLNIRMSNIRPSNNFNPDYNTKYLPDNYAERYKDFLLFEGDIIIAMTDMASDPKILGVPTIINNLKGRNFLLNQRVGKIFNIDNSKIEIMYLKEILSSRLIKEYYNQQGARGVQINISKKQILSARIPLPPIKKQNEIAEHIKAIREQAKQLKTEAIEVLEQAKQETEKMILGE